jgi:hypothetical protein
MERSFSKIKDVDLKILSELDDKSLFQTCMTNKYINNICSNEDFWRNRYIKKFGLEAIKYKPDEKTWKKHYLQVAIDLDRFTTEPLKFISHVHWSPRGEKYSFFFFNGGISSFETAPEWMKNNFYLLDVGLVNIFGKEFSHITPYEFFKKYSEYTVNPYETLDGLGMYNYLVLWRNYKNTQKSREEENN